MEDAALNACRISQPERLMRFSFSAKNRNSGVTQPSELVISDPVENDMGLLGYFCEIRITGFAQLERRIYGATPFQAAKLALQIAAILMSEFEPEWAFCMDGHEFSFSH